MIRSDRESGRIFRKRWVFGLVATLGILVLTVAQRALWSSSARASLIPAVIDHVLETGELGEVLPPCVTISPELAAELSARQFERWHSMFPDGFLFGTRDEVSQMLSDPDAELGECQHFRVVEELNGPLFGMVWWIWSTERLDARMTSVYAVHFFGRWWPIWHGRTN